MTTHVPPFATPDDDAAFRLGRYVDALVANQDASVPEQLSDLARLSRELLDAPRAAAPESLHTRAKAQLNEHPDWLKQLTSQVAPYTNSPMNHNGHVRRARVMAPPRPTPGMHRHLISFVGLALLVAVIAFLIYTSFGREEMANLPTVVVSPIASPVPTAPATASPRVAISGVGDWPMRGGSATHTGGADRSIPDSVPTQRWSVTLAEGIRYPVVAGDSVFITNGGVLFALASDTGIERWHFDLGVPPSVAGANPPAVVGGVVFIGAHNGVVIAIDAVSGQERWRYDTGGTITTAVAVSDNTVITGTVEGALIAIDATTGAKRWTYQTGTISTSSPVIAENTVFVGAGGDKIFAIDLTTGQLLWNQPVKPGMQTLAVGNGIAVAAGTNTSSAILLIAMNAKTGTVLWQGQTPTDMPVAILNGSVYVVGGGVISLDQAHGNQKWQFPLTLKIVDYAFAGDDIALCRKDGTAVVVDAKTGKELWRVVTSTAGSGIAVGVRTIYVSHNDGVLSAFSDE